MTPREGRAFDLVLFGATGFTGRLVARYLATARPSGLRWALAGRSREKLEDVRRELARLDAALADLPIELADAGDRASLDALVARTRAVCTTVGPYARHGHALVGACATAGTDYCDLTGEVTFMRDAIDRHDAAARASGARIVPACGFDSIPSDLGVFLLHEHFVARGTRLASARLYVESTRGGVSGGTIASLFAVLEDAGRDRARRRLVADPYALQPDRERDRGPDGPDQTGMRWDADAGRWTGPFVMASINTRVVRRSNALLGFPYGRDFRYGEVLAFRPGVKGFALAAGATLGTGLFVALASAGPTRRLLARALPAPGEGPSEAVRASGHFEIRVLGLSAEDASGRRRRAAVRIRSEGDPGYDATARMLGEAALALARDEISPSGGLLTPAACFGTRLVERLRRAGMIWSVGRGPPDAL